jgi:hypothetical protein
VVGAEILVESALLEHVVGGGEHGGGVGADGLFCPASGAPAVELRPKVADLPAGGGSGALDQGRLEPGSAFAHTGGAAFPGALVDLGVEPRRCPSMGLIPGRSRR